MALKSKHRTAEGITMLIAEMESDHFLASIGLTVTMTAIVIKTLATTKC